MLHILLLILKILGIIILAILGILVLLICIVLFVPVRYEIFGKCNGTMDTLKAKVKVTWLLHLLKADILYGKKTWKWRARLAWIVRSNNAPKAVKKEVELNEKEDEEIKIPEKPEEKLEENNKTVEASIPEKKSEKIEKEPESICRESEEKRSDFKENAEKQKESVFQKIKKKYVEVCDKIKVLLEKKEKITELLKEPVHVDAVKKLWVELKKLLRRLKPKKFQAKIRFGFDDPYTTGQVLAVLGMIYPFVGEVTEVVPDFENKILKGTLYAKGKVRIIHLVAFAWNLIWCKNVRTTYKDIKSFKL